MAGRQAASAAVVSFKLKDFAAGGILAEGDYLVEESRFMNWDYDGKVANASTIALRLMLRLMKGGKPDGELIPQYYSAGDPGSFSPDETGTKLVATSERSQVSKSSNFFTFIENLVNAGFDEDKFDNDSTAFEGLIAHFIQIKQQERQGLPSSNLVQGQQAQEKTRTIPVVSAIIKLPWDKVGAKPAAKATAAAPAANKATAPKPVAATNGTGDATDLFKEYFLATAKAEGLPYARTKTRIKMFRLMTEAGVEVGARDAALEPFKDNSVLENILSITGEGYILQGDDIAAVG